MGEVLLARGRKQEAHELLCFVALRRRCKDPHSRRHDEGPGTAPGEEVVGGDHGVRSLLVDPTKQVIVVDETGLDVAVVHGCDDDRVLRIGAGRVVCHCFQPLEGGGFAVDEDLGGHECEE